MIPSSLRIFVQGMTCDCCAKLLYYIFRDEGIEAANIGNGWVDLKNPDDYDAVCCVLKENGFNPISDKDKILVEQIKQAIFELIHLSNNNNSIIRNSDYLVEKLEYSYTKLAKVFSDNEHKTIERYIIEQKIERTKHLLQIGHMSLSEIAFQMGYSSSQYLSTQFKQITGQSVSAFKATL